MSINFKNIPQEETPPKAGAMINTFRAFGYNLKTAIADIIDNSISANADNIWINYEWNGADSCVKITDNGIGMNKSELIQAMTPGSKDPKENREDHDLGRFGLGLKTSSFSQCKMLTVSTKKKEFKIINRCWDLDFVNKSEKWILLNFISDENFTKSLEELNSGTTVIWEKMDRLVGNANKNNEAAMNVFLQEFADVEDHLSLVFHRYLEQKKITIHMNGRKIEPWDPFMKQSEGGQLIASESVDMDQVKIKCYLLPHVSKLTVEERKKAKTDEWYKLTRVLYLSPKSSSVTRGLVRSYFLRMSSYKNARILD